MRRLRGFQITPLALLDWARGECEVVATDIPKDAELRHTGIDPWTGNIHIAVEHPSFDQYEEGERMTFCDVRVQRKS